MPENENAFKNMINASVVKKMGAVFKAVDPAFNTKQFQKLIPKLQELELKARVLLLTKGLKDQLPEDYIQAKKILEKVLSKHELTGFQLWPISEYISQFGTDHLDESMELMYQLTQQFTSEFAVRPFLNKQPEKILKKFESWLKDENVHIRRWISEGTRPLLPWGAKIQSFIKKPATLHLLDELKFDKELYVRKSVANHLNDISKHHPELVVKTLREWIKKTPTEHEEKILWIKRHGLRTLIKKGHKGALELMGVSDKVQAEITILKLNKKDFVPDDYLEFEFILHSRSKKKQKMIVDYSIGFIKANGSLSFKVFKLKTIDLAAGEKLVIKKRHPLKKITTRTFYPGKHELNVQVNGKVLKKVSWNFHP